MLSQPLIKELQKILKTEYGLDFDMEKVSRFGRELSNYYDLLAEINFENAKNLNKTNNQVERPYSSAIIIK